MRRTTSIKKHTETVKQTLLAYAAGSIACVYAGFLCGAAWVPDNDLFEFLLDILTDDKYHMIETSFNRIMNRVIHDDMI